MQRTIHADKVNDMATVIVGTAGTVVDTEESNDERRAQDIQVVVVVVVVVVVIEVEATFIKFNYCPT